MTPFQLAPGARLNATLLGQEQEPLLQSDGILADPDELVRGASASDLLPAYSPAGGFPGLRSALPSDYIQKVVNVLTGPIAEAFSLGAVRPIRAQGAFSLVTLPPDALETQGLAFIQKGCSRQPAVCSSAEFQSLNTQLTELQAQQQELQQASRRFGSSPELAREQARLVNLQAAVTRQLVNLLIS